MFYQGIKQSDIKMTILSGKDIFTADFNRFDFIVPLNYEEASFCLSKVPNFTSQLICAHPVTISLLNNKYDFWLWLCRNGFKDNTPKIYSAFVGEWYLMPPEIKYPAIFKPISSYSGIGVRILKNEQRLKTTDKNYIIQEYIIAPEHYVAHFYVKDGIIKWNVTFVAKNKKFHIKKGAIKNYKVADINIGLFKEIFSKLNYNSFACCDFKIKDGVIKIFEINARIGGSLLNNEKYYQQALSAMVEANQLQEA